MVYPKKVMLSRSIDKIRAPQFNPALRSDSQCFSLLSLPDYSIST